MFYVSGLVDPMTVSDAPTAAPVAHVPATTVDEQLTAAVPFEATPAAAVPAAATELKAEEIAPAETVAD